MFSPYWFDENVQLVSGLPYVETAKFTQLWGELWFVTFTLRRVPSDMWTRLTR